MKSKDNWTLKQNTISHHRRSVCSISSVAMKQQYTNLIEYNQHNSETMTLHAGKYVTGVHSCMHRPTPRQLLCHIPSHLSINGKMKGWNEMFEWLCLTLRLAHPATTKYPGPKTGQFLPEPTADPTISTISTGKPGARYHTGLIPSCGICSINWPLKSHTRSVMPERAECQCLITARGESAIPVVSGKYWAFCSEWYLWRGEKPWLVSSYNCRGWAGHQYALLQTFGYYRELGADVPWRPQVEWTSYLWGACAEFDWTLSSAFEGYLPGIMVVVDGCAWCSEDW